MRLIMENSQAQKEANAELELGGHRVMLEKSLFKLTRGQSGKITKIQGTRQLQRRLTELGLTEGRSRPPHWPQPSPQVGYDPRIIPNFVLSDAQSLPFLSRTFTAAICSHVLEHLPNPRARTSNMKKGF